METKTGNKLIAAFMGTTWYDSFVECREKKLDLYQEQAIGKTDEEKGQLSALIEEQHQWQPEYHNSYDRMIPVIRRLKERLKEEFGMAMYAIECMSGLNRSLCYEDKPHLFNLLCEIIAQFNQLTKNKSNGGNNC